MTKNAFRLDGELALVTGGGTVLVLEDAEHAAARGARIYAEVNGWGQSTDGYNVIAPEPSGSGLARAMRSALADADDLPNRRPSMIV